VAEIAGVAAVTKETKPRKRDTKPLDRETNGPKLGTKQAIHETALNSIVDIVLAYRPKAKSKPARRRKRRAAKIAKAK
jgi:hypothetical protein